MQISTILALTGSLICVFGFAHQRRWLFALGCLSSAVYTLLDKVIQPSSIPPFVADLFAYIFVACIAAECFRIWRKKQQAGTIAKLE